jgi:hypothetical protein
MKDVLVEDRAFHVYACDYVEVRPGLFERVYHVVRHVGANSRLSVYPPAHQKNKGRTRTKSAQLATHARDTDFGHFCASVIMHKVHETASDEERCD